MLRAFSGTHFGNHIWALALALALFLFSYSESIHILVVIWSGVENSADSYGFLIVACTVYLLFQKRDEFHNLPHHPSWLALISLLCFTFIWLVAMLVGVQSAQLAMLPLILLAAITVILGYEYFKLAFMPIAIIYFAIPVWWPLLPYLMDVTTYVTKLSLQIIGRPVFVEGYYMHLPGGTFLIDPGCAGLRFLMVTLALSFISIDMYSMKIRSSAILLCAGVGLALIANWIRVLVVVLIGDYTNMQHSFVYDHNTFGWILYFFLVLGPFFILSRILSPSVQQRNVSVVVAEKENTSRIRSAFLVYFLCCLFILLGPVTYTILKSQDFKARNSIGAPGAVASWRMVAQSMDASESDWKPMYVGASDYVYAQYVSGGKTISINIVSYSTQQQGAELINSLNSITDDQSWSEIVDTRRAEGITTNSGDYFTLETLEVRSRSGNIKLVKYWYSIGGRITANEFRAKLLQVASLFKRRSDASLVAFSIDCDINCSSSNSILNDFISEIQPTLDF